MIYLKKKYIILFVVLAMFIGVWRFYPYFVYKVPLGYDPGLYRLYFLEYLNMLPKISFEGLSQWSRQWEPMLGILMGFVQKLGINVDFLLRWGLGFISVFTVVPIYLFLKRYGKKEGLLGVLLFSMSIIQYQALSYTYYKQIVAIILLLFILIFLQRKNNYLLLFGLSFILFVLHRPTGLFFVLMYGVYIVMIYCKKKIFYKGEMLSIILAGVFSLVVYWPLRNELLLPFLKPLVETIFVSHSGTFFTKIGFLKYNMIYIVLLLWGLYSMDIKRYNLIFSGFVVGLVWTGFSLFFFNRMFVLFDLFIILYLAVFLGKVLKSKKNISWLFVSFAFLLQLILYVVFVLKTRPLISENEFYVIKNINKVVLKNDYVIVTHSNYSPWLVGYVSANVVAPGLFEYNKWDLVTWKKWWNGDAETRCSMLKDYIRSGNNLYLWIGERQINFELNCGEKVLNGEKLYLYKIDESKLGM